MNLLYSLSNIFVFFILVKKIHSKSKSFLNSLKFGDLLDKTYIKHLVVKMLKNEVVQFNLIFLFYVGRLYAMQTGMKIDSKTPECRKFLSKLMDQLETVS